MPYELPELLGEDMAREGMRRLKPLSMIAAQLSPKAKNEAEIVCLLESSNYMRNQLLRDADWAGMAHSLEIRVPLVDWNLAQALAPSIATHLPGAGKEALALAPALALPEFVRSRRKTGFSVPTGSWMAQATGPAVHNLSKGQASRRWAKLVLKTPSFWMVQAA